MVVSRAIPAVVDLHARQALPSRRSNLGMVLRLLRDRGPRSRSRIVTDTGLPKATVSTLTAELVALGLVREGEAAREGGIGRPSQQVALKPDGACAVGVEIGTTYVTAVVVGLDGEELWRTTQALDVHAAGQEQVLDVAAQLIRQAHDAAATRGGRVVGIGVGTPGTVDVEPGIVRFAANLGWRDVALAHALRDRLGPSFPEIAVENDARVAAIAEFTRYARHGVHDLVLITGERGVGGGIITNGTLVRGYTGCAGEIGHAPLGRPGTPCVCGRHGCWENEVGMHVLLSHAADEDDPVRDASRPLADRLDELHLRAEAGDARTLDALGRVAAGLTEGLHILSDLLNPQIIVLGGYFARFADYFIPGVERGFADRALVPTDPQVTVVPSELGFTAASHGAAAMMLELVFNDPTRVADTLPRPAGRAAR